jgi:hypothetical protein
LYTSKYETLTLTERLEDASMSPYKWDMVRILMPAWLLSFPIIVYVFPDPVAP